MLKILPLSLSNKSNCVPSRPVDPFIKKRENLKSYVLPTNDGHFVITYTSQLSHLLTNLSCFSLTEKVTLFRL